MSDDEFVKRVNVIESGGRDVLGSESIIGCEDREASFGEIAIESRVDIRNSSDPSTAVNTDHLSSYQSIKSWCGACMEKTYDGSGS